MGHTYLICRKSTHTDLIDTNGIPLHGCPYCEIDKLRGELAQVTKEREQAKMLSERFFEQRNKRNNDLVALRKELKNANRGAKKNHDVARLAVQEAITLRKALESVCKGISLMSSPGSLRISWEAIMEDALQNAKEAE